MFIPIPIGSALYGKSSVLPIALLISVETGIIVTLAIVLLVIESGERNNFMSVVLTALRAIFINPIVLSILFCVAVAFMEIELRAVLDDIVNLIQGATIPCSLYATGASLAGLFFSGQMKETGFMALSKLLLYPVLVFVFMSMFSGIPSEWINIAVIAAASPIGASFYLIASTYNTYVERSSVATSDPRSIPCPVDYEITCPPATTARLISATSTNTF